MCPAKMTNIAHELCGPFGCLCRVWSFVIPLAGTRLMVTGPGPGRNPRDPRPRGRPGTPRGPPGACRPQRFGGPEGKRCACVIIYTNAGATFYAHNHHHPGPKSQVNTRDAHVHRPTPTPCGRAAPVGLWLAHAACRAPRRGGQKSLPISFFARVAFFVALVELLDLHRAAGVTHKASGPR